MNSNPNALGSFEDLGWLDPVQGFIEKFDERSLDRRRRRRQIDDGDTRLRRLERESETLARIRSEAPLIELDEPFQRGWVRYFTLKAEAKRRADASRLHQVAPLIECRQFCRTGKWTAWSLKRKRMVPMRHAPRRFTPGEILRKRPARELLKYFATEHHGLRVSSYDQLLWLYRRSHGGRLDFVYPQLLEVVVEPYMITHQRAHFPEIERRLDEIERVLESGGRERLEWLNGRRSYRFWNWRFELPLAERSAREDMRRQVRDALEGIPPEPVDLPITPIVADGGAGNRAFFVSRPSVHREAA